MKIIYEFKNNTSLKASMNSKYIFFTAIFCLIFNLNTFAQTLEDCIKIKDSGFVAMDKIDYPAALEYLTKAQLIAEKNNWHLEVFETKNNIGIIYVNLSDYGEALNYYLDAYTVAIKHLDSNKEMAVLNNIAVIYCSDDNFEKGREYYLKAYNLAKSDNDKNKIALYGINLAKVANHLNELDVARDYLNEAIVFAKGDETLVLHTEATLAENLLLRGDFEAARKKLFDLLAQTKIKNFRNKDINSTTYNLLARTYYLEKNYDKSIYYINKCLSETEDFETRSSLYGSLSDAYVHQSKFDLALEAMKMMVASKDSLASINRSNLYESNKVKFDVLNYKNELNATLEKSVLERKIFGAAIIFFIVLTFLVYRMFRNRAIKQEQKKIIAEGEQKIIALELEKEKNNKLLLEKQINEIENEALLEQENLKSEIDQKNRKLSAKALYLSGRNEMIEEVIDSLSRLTDVSQNSILKSHIKVLKEHLKSDSEWDDFVVHFEEVNQGLLNSLKERHPSLTSNDIRFICYVYMNLSSKEICTILNITQEACRKRKERIFNKMNIDKNTSFYEYLSTIKGSIPDNHVFS